MKDNLRASEGFTLIELLVYMAIMGFIIVVAGRVFSDSSVMRVRSQNMLRSAEEVGKVTSLISEDISQMGVKAYGEISLNGFSVNSNSDVYVSKNANSSTGCTDCSSFWLFKNNATSAADAEIAFDSLAFRKAAFSDGGEFLGVREISWAVNPAGQLFRYCATISGTSDDECPEENASQVLIAENIKRFSFIPSAPGVAPSTPGTGDIPRDTVFPPETQNPINQPFRLIANSDKDNARGIIEGVQGMGPSAVLELSGNFKRNDEDAGNKSEFTEVYFSLPQASDYTECLEFEIDDGETYVVEFNMPFPIGGNSDSDAAKRDSSSGQFLPGLDHIAVGLRDNEGRTIGSVSSDVLLYASQSQEADNLPRYTEFSAKGNSSNVCVAITFAFYSPLASRGKYRFSNFKIYKKQTGAYHFVKTSNNYTEDFAQNYATETDTRRLNHKKNVKAFELILEIDRNGEVAGTYSKGSVAEGSTGMAIPVPNNGVAL